MRMGVMINFEIICIFDRMIHQKNEPPLISTYLRSPNVQELLYSIFFLLLVTGYLVTHFLIFCRAFIKLQTELEKVKYLMIPSYMIELQKLLDRYPPHKQNSFGLTVSSCSRKNMGFRQHAMGWWSRLWGQINTFYE